MFRLETFAGLVMVDETGAKVVTQPRRLALLALLAVAGPRGLTRAKVHAHLWPESSAESARHGLEQLLYYLRRQLGPDAFLDQDPLRLNPTVLISDVADFEETLGRAADAEAAAIYRGPFLDGFFVNGAPGFERWVEEERSRLAEAYRDALRRLAEAERDQERHREAAGWWRRLIASDPLSERAALGLMQALVATGDRPAAMVFARGYASLVREELAAPLSPDVAMYMANLGEAAPPPSVEPAVSGPVPWPTAHPGLVSGHGSVVTVAPSLPNRPDVRRPRNLLAVGVGLGAMVTIGAFLTLGLRQTDIPTSNPNLVAVAPFDVLGSGLDLWHEGVVDLLSRRLDGAGPLRSVAPSVVIRRWHGRADEPSAVELGRQTGAGTVIYGSLVGLGADSVRLNATLLEVGGRRSVFELELRSTVDQMDRLIDSSAVELLEELGRTRAIGPVRYAQTASLPALKAFLRGEQYFRRMTLDSARHQFERAIALDSTFALALRHLSEVQRWRLGASDSFRTYAFRAAAFNHGLPSRESLMVVADSLEAAIPYPSDAAVFGTARRWLSTWEEAASRYPDDPEAWYGLGEARVHLGPVLGVTRQQQLDAFDRAIAIDSGFLHAEPHAVSLGIRLGGAALGRRYAAVYLAHALGDPWAAAIRVVDTILAQPTLDSASMARWAHSLQREPAIPMALDALGHLPDQAEAGLRLVQATSGPGGRFSDPATDRSRLAKWLASRGHLREAAGLLGSSLSANRPHVFVDLTLLDAVPAETAAVVFDAWRRGEELAVGRGSVFLAGLALPWWAAKRDTLTLHWVARRARAGARADTGEARRDSWRYLTHAAGAYLALARQDTTAALDRLLALPDSLCLECHFDRLQTALLLAAAGRDREAYQRLEAVFPGETNAPLPSEVLWILVRARVAERLGEREVAATAYAWVLGIWHNADARLQVYVTEARAGLARCRQTDARKLPERQP
jgi:DNA-binding SARP family transcriptional activator